MPFLLVLFVANLLDLHGRWTDPATLEAWRPTMVMIVQTLVSVVLAAEVVVLLAVWLRLRSVVESTPPLPRPARWGTQEVAPALPRDLVHRN